MTNNEFKIENGKSWKRIVFLGLALLIVIGLTVGTYFYTKFNQAASSESVPVNFTINKGASTKSIGKQLADDHIISSYWAFIFYTKLKSAAGKIQAGSYVLDRKMSISQIVDVITAGKVVPSDRRVTVVEGLTNKQLGASLENRSIFSAAEFNSALSAGDFSFKYNTVGKQFGYEGFLFPDTYQIPKDAGVNALIQKMLSNFESKITPELESKIAARNLDIKSVITMASIIEKEVGRNTQSVSAEDIELMKQERRLVASVFFNRLQIGMKLESDATVNYVTGKSDRSASFEDLEIKSPYNTYQVTGLPPSPIANPGMDSILAAIEPAESDYLFFLSDPAGKAYFAKTLAEHNANRVKYLR